MYLLIVAMAALGVLPEWAVEQFIAMSALGLRLFAGCVVFALWHKDRWMLKCGRESD
jgi:hypothetical protein